MKIIFKIILFFFLFTNICNAELIKPNINLKPFDVLMIQLNSLKNNNSPYKDAGIEQTWEFAHPNNKIFTGPLERFKKMIYSDNYKILISHENTKAIVLKESPTKLVFKVHVLSKDKKKILLYLANRKGGKRGKFEKLLDDYWSIGPNIFR